jgi:hypothetical protein
MEFNLLYQGELLPSGNQSRAKEKHAIRRVFHPQLRRLWSVKPILRSLAHQWFVRVQSRASPLSPDLSFEEARKIECDLGLQAIGKYYAKAGYELVPLVSPEYVPQCAIEILVLRPGERILFDERGDLDGQVRTILDALRMPDNPGETGGAQPEDDEHPLFCLLQNDKFISEVKIIADELLQLPEQGINHRERENAIARLNQMLYGASMPDEDRAALELARKVLQRRGEVKANDAYVIVNIRLNHRDQL